MWEVERRAGAAGELHALDLGGRPSTVWRLEPDRPALVLGSTQPRADVDAEVAARRGVEVVRRRSGGGAVLLQPGSSVWVDVVIGRDDPRWEEDVGRSALWLGRAWATALGEGAEVHTGAGPDRGGGRVVCFAGLGAGEVTLGGRKVVGISQRRDRRGARLQCVVHRRWDPDLSVELLAPGLGAGAGEMAVHLRRTVATVGDPEALVDRLLAVLAG